MFVFDQDDKQIITDIMNRHGQLNDDDLADLLIDKYKHDRVVRTLITRMHTADPKLTLPQVVQEFRDAASAWQTPASDAGVPFHFKSSPSINFDPEPECYCDSKLLASYGHEKHCRYKQWKDRKAAVAIKEDEVSRATGLDEWATSMFAGPPKGHFPDIDTDYSNDSKGCLYLKATSIAKGRALDYMGALWGIKRIEIDLLAEDDADYRKRILEKIKS